MLITIDFTKFNLSLKLWCCLFIFWLKCFTMSTPWGIKLNHPDVLRLHNCFIEITLCQYNYLILTAWATAAATRWWLFLLWIQSLLDWLTEHGHNCLNNFLCWLSACIEILCLWLFVEREPFNWWESLDIVFMEYWSILVICFVHVNCTNLNNSLK